MSRLRLSFVLFVVLVLSGCAGIPYNQILAEPSYPEQTDNKTILSMGMHIGPGNLKSFTAMVYVNGHALTPKGVVKSGVYSENRVPSACFTQFWLLVGNLCVPGPGEVSTNHYKKFYPTIYYEQKNEEVIYIYWEVPPDFLDEKSQAIAFIPSFRAPGLDGAKNFLHLGALEDSTKKPSIGVWSWDAYSIAPYEYEQLTIDDKRNLAKWEFTGNRFAINKPGVYYLGDLDLSGHFEVKKTEIDPDKTSFTGTKKFLYVRNFDLKLLKVDREKYFQKKIIGKRIESTTISNKSGNWKIFNGYDFTKYQQGISPDN